MLKAVTCSLLGTTEERSRLITRDTVPRYGVSTEEDKAEAGAIQKGDSQVQGEALYGDSAKCTEKREKFAQVTHSMREYKSRKDRRGGKRGEPKKGSCWGRGNKRRPS